MREVKENLTIASVNIFDLIFQENCKIGTDINSILNFKINLIDSGLYKPSLFLKNHWGIRIPDLMIFPKTPGIFLARQFPVNIDPIQFPTPQNRRNTGDCYWCNDHVLISIQQTRETV